MRPGRYFPSKTSTVEIIDNLAYCMQTMCEAEKEAREGIGFMAYMEDWHYYYYYYFYYQACLLASRMAGNLVSCWINSCCCHASVSIHI
jgi:hypothetical protein